VVSTGHSRARKIRSPLWDASSRSSDNVSVAPFPVRPEQRWYEPGQDLRTRIDDVHDVSLVDEINGHLRRLCFAKDIMLIRIRLAATMSISARYLDPNSAGQRGEEE
jgi:hypothetical protein